MGNINAGNKPMQVNKNCGVCKKRFLGGSNPKERGGGKYCSRVCANEGIRVSKLAEKNPHWAGKKVGYAGLHRWVAHRLHKPEQCESCGEVKRLDLANISQKYKRDLTDWEWLCRKCHMTKDGRIKNMKKIGKISLVRLKRNAKGRFVSAGVGPRGGQ